MPIQDSAPCLGHTLRVVFQHGGANSLTSVHLCPDVPVDEMTNILLGEYTVIPNATPHCITSPVNEAASPEDPVQNQQAVITSRDHARPLAPSPLHSNNDSFASEVTSSAETRRPAIDDGNHDSNEAIPVQHKVAKTRVALLIVGALSLVVVPGLVVGVVTEQVQWGIALSGAIATIVSFFAGLYYYHNK